MIPHFSVLANVVQMAHYTGAKDERRPLEMQRYPPGSKCLGRKFFSSSDEGSHSDLRILQFCHSTVSFICDLGGDIGRTPVADIYGLVVVLHFHLLVGVSSRSCATDPVLICAVQTTVVVVQKFNFEQMLDSIQKYRITHLW